MNLEILVNSGALDRPSDVLIFFGRFHPLLVHLPIGFLVLAILAQFSVRWPKFQPLATYIPYLWGLGALSALATVVSGYFLSLSGDYDADILFWHKWSGIAVFLFSVACFYLSKKKTKLTHFTKWPLLIIVTGSLIYTGHLGGNLTHGSTYLLEYAPNPIRGLAGMPPKSKPRKKVTVLDSADVFLDVILPIMNSKCTSCHNDGKKKGDLLLTSHSNIMKGGENGEVIIPGDTEASELFRRITLPENHDDFMPSEGKRPLSDEEVDLLEWWIMSGAPSTGFVTQLDPEKRIMATANSYFGLDKNNLLNKIVSPPDATLIDSLHGQGFVINRLMKGNNYIEANYSLSEKAIETLDLDLLLKLKEQLIWLNLGNSGVKDAHLEKIGQLENLIKLDLSRNAITDLGLKHLSKLTNLEYLNLYESQVSEGLLEVIPKMTRLQKIYLWKTKVQDTLVEQLRTINKNLFVVFERDEVAGN
jgi:uncharacterized membrane protein